MKPVAAVLFALCGMILLLTWHDSGRWYWIWQYWLAQSALYHAIGKTGMIGDSLSSMEPLDFVLKIAGIVLIAVAVMIRPRATKEP